MLALFAASLIAGAATTSSSTASSSGPMREVVYKFSDDERTEYSTDQSVNGDVEKSTATNGLAAPPQSQTTATGYSGTMTVDILQVDPSGYLKASIHETTDAANGARPFDATFIVRPDGQLVTASGSPDADMTGLMSYFATKYFGDHVLSQGEQWIDGSIIDKVEYDTTSTVTNVNGDDITIRKVMKVPGAANGSLYVDTMLVYNAAKLVPITLDIRSTHRGGGTTANAEQISHYHFDRVSDTLDTSH